MFTFFSTSRATRALSALLVSLSLLMMMVACGDNTSTSAPAAAPVATSAATTAAAMTTSSATTAAATTAAAMTTNAATTAAMTTSATTTAAATTSATTTGATTTAAATTAAVTAASIDVGNASTTGTPKISLQKLKFGAIPSENATKVFDTTKPLAEALSKELGIPVTLYVGNNYTAVIEALSSGKIDVAWFGPFSYILANSKYNAEVFAEQLDSKGADSYNSLIITTPKSGIKTLADLKGHSFSFVDPASTSGHLIPLYTLTKAGIDPDKDVKAIYAGSHDASLLGVLSGKTDAGAVASDVFQNLIDQGKVNPNDVVIINKSDPIPESPIAYRKELSDGDKAAIKAAFLNMKDPAALKSVSIAGFVDVKDTRYDGLRDIAKSLNLDLTKLK